MNCAIKLGLQSHPQGTQARTPRSRKILHPYLSLALVAHGAYCTLKSPADCKASIDSGFWIFVFKLVDHRITLSALANTCGGIVRPICLAVLRLMTSSNFVGCSTGRSAGLAPLRILST